jgi:hypothetical protein
MRYPCYNRIYNSIITERNSGHVSLQCLTNLVSNERSKYTPNLRLRICPCVLPYVIFAPMKTGMRAIPTQ